MTTKAKLQERISELEAQLGVQAAEQAQAPLYFIFVANKNNDGISEVAFNTNANSEGDLRSLDKGLKVVNEEIQAALINLVEQRVRASLTE